MIANFPAKMTRFNIGDNLQRNSPFFNLKSVKNVENKIENVKTNLFHEAINKEESNHRRMLSERPIKVSNRNNSGFKDPEIEDLINHHGLGYEVLSPYELNEVLKGTPFDNEEDLAEIIYRYSSLWESDELEEADHVFQNDEGYHSAIGLRYVKGNHSCIEKDYEKALYHLNKALDLPASISLIIGIYGQQRDFVLAHQS